MIKKYNLLILYNPLQLKGNIIDNLSAYGLYSKMNIFYSSQSSIKLSIEEVNEYFDAIMLHWNYRLAFNQILPSTYNLFKKFRGVKVAFAQDEYDFVLNTIKNINKLKIDFFFTTVPKKYIKDIYKDVSSKTKILSILTGYVDNSRNSYIYKKNRPFDVGYRGRELPIKYGTLGLEKGSIGNNFIKYYRNITMKKQHKLNLKFNISSKESDRLYGDDWFNFLNSCYCMLGTESGSNLIDFDNDLEDKLKKKLAKKGFKESDLEMFYLANEKKDYFNQLSPKIFEYIQCRTVPILFEGRYSNIIKKDIHYISLKKDFSNLEEVVKKVNNKKYLYEISENAYKDIILSNKYSYESYMLNIFDKAILEALEKKKLSYTFTKNYILQRLTFSSVYGIYFYPSSDARFDIFIPHRIRIGRHKLNYFMFYLSYKLYSLIIIRILNTLTKSVLLTNLVVKLKKKYPNIFKIIKKTILM